MILSIGGAEPDNRDPRRGDADFLAVAEVRHKNQTLVGEADAADRQHIAVAEEYEILGWDRWHHHWVGGGTAETFKPGYGVNDIFMHFWNRKKTHRPAPDRRAQSE